jgi:hypothetical protein
MPKFREYTEKDYYEMVDACLNDSLDVLTHDLAYPMDKVASRTEWAAFKAALLRWLEHMDREAEAGFAQFDAENPEDPS